jgi:hypothetical protein
MGDPHTNAELQNSKIFHREGREGRQGNPLDRHHAQAT